MAIESLRIYGDPNIGVFFFVNEDYAITPPSIPSKALRVIKESLKVDVIKTTIGGTILIGSLVAGNSKGILLPHYTLDEELEKLKRLDVDIGILPSRRTALGNLILANSYAAMVHPAFEDEAVGVIEEVLKVKVLKGSIASIPLVGSIAIATDKGLIAHPLTKDDELKKLSEMFKVASDVGTVNKGSSFIRLGIIANSKGAVIGADTTGLEIAKIEQVLGLTK